MKNKLRFWVFLIMHFQNRWLKLGIHFQLIALATITGSVIFIINFWAYEDGFFHIDVPETNGNDSLYSLARQEKKLILMWTPFFKSWLISPKATKDCPLIKANLCEITMNKKMLKVADVVLFHWRDVKIGSWPKKDPKQKWVLLNFESPMNSPRKVSKKLGRSIDWIMSYRLDSDIYAPYGMVKSKLDHENHLQTYLADNLTLEDFQKKKLATWLVSNCLTSSNRHLYGKELQKYVTVDIFGYCGNKTSLCSNQTTSQECYQNFAKHYKFYLSFENSLCQDYITEKFFLALKYGMVPVVLGGANYSKIAPEHSYINALDYESPKDLAKYLNEVANNFTLYKTYLSWRKNYFVDPNYDLFTSLCTLCSQLIWPTYRQMSNQRRDVTRWWYRKSSCWSWFPN